MDERVLEVRNVSYRYHGSVQALSDVNLDVMQGERVGILGQNGAGKSTLIMLIAGLFRPDSGEVKVFGASTTSREFDSVRSRIGLVFQDPEDQLFSNSVLEDVSYAPRNLGMEEGVANAMSEKALRSVNSLHLRDRPPHRLSFGEKKRVSIATALVMRPELLILDEPTANLDSPSRRELVRTLNALNSGGVTVVISTHDVEILPETVDRVIVINNGRTVSSGGIREVMSDKALLESASLEPPPLSRLFMELQSRSLVNRIPLTYDEALSDLIDLIARRGKQDEGLKKC